MESNVRLGNLFLVVSHFSGDFKEFAQVQMWLEYVTYVNPYIHAGRNQCLPPLWKKKWTCETDCTRDLGPPIKLTLAGLIGSASRNAGIPCFAVSGSNVIRRPNSMSIRHLVCSPCQLSLVPTIFRLRKCKKITKNQKDPITSSCLISWSLNQKSKNCTDARETL